MISSQEAKKQMAKTLLLILAVALAITPLTFMLPARADIEIIPSESALVEETIQLELPEPAPMRAQPSGALGDYLYSLGIEVEAVDPQGIPSGGTFEIAAGADDGYRRLISTPGTQFDNNDDYCDFGKFNVGGNDYWVDSFFRFDSVTIPGNATITDAYLVFESYQGQFGTTVNTNIYAELDPDPDAVNSYADGGWSDLTTEFVAWDAIPAWSLNESGPDTTTGNISAIVQELIEQGGWASGQAMQFFVFNDGSSTDAYRRPESKDQAGGDPAALHIEWTEVAPSVPDSLVVNLDVFRGSPTVEEGTWTVNSRSCSERIEWNIYTYDALPGNYTVEVFVDTAALVEGEYLGSGNGNATTLEFDVATPSDGLPYWITQDENVSLNFNSTLSRYFVNLVKAQGNYTTLTFYLYIPDDTDSESSNFDGDETFVYFEGFDTAVPNVTAFLGNYTTWAKIESPVVVVANSILKVTGSAGANTDIVYEDDFAIQDFRAYFRIDTIQVQSYTGLFAEDGSPYHMAYNSGGNEFYDSVLGSVNSDYFPIPFTMRSDHVSTWTNGIIYQLDGAGNIYPDKYITGTTEAAENFYPRVAVATTYTNYIEIDSIAFSKNVNKPPDIVFPDILYAKPGRIFLFDHMENWENDFADFAITDVDLNQFYWWPDPRVQLTKHPAGSTQIAVLVELDLSINQMIYAWYGNAGQTEPDEYQSAAGVYGGTNFYDGFANDDAWTVKDGTFAVGNVTEAIVDKGGIGNAPGGAYWSRRLAIVDVGSEDYWGFLITRTFEHSELYWPAPARTYLGQVRTELDEPWYPIERAWYNVFISGMLQDAFMYDGTTYVILNSFETSGGGLELFYVDNEDIDDPTAYSLNPNGPFLTPAWLNGKEGTSIHQIINYSFLRHTNGVWYVLINGTQSVVAAERGDCYMAHTSDAPEDWDALSFTSDGKVLENSLTPTWIEDADFAFDGTDWWIYIYVSTGTYGVNAWKLNAATPTAAFAAQGAITLNDKPSFAGVRYGAPRMFYDGTQWYMALYGSPTEATPSYPQQWTSNWNFIATNSAGNITLGMTWNCLNPELKYEQTETAAIDNYSYIGNTSFSTDSGLEIIAEVTLNFETGTDGVGVIWDYDNTADTGYVAYFYYNSGSPVCYLSKFVGASLTTLDSYAIGFYPDPTFAQGYPARLKVQDYGTHMVVYYSLNGKPWVEACEATDSTYTGDEVGVWTLNVAGNFDNFRVREYLEIDAIVGMGDEYDYHIFKPGPGIGPFIIF